VAIAGPVAAAVAELARAVVIIVIAAVVLAAISGGALVAYRLRLAARAPRALPSEVFVKTSVQGRPEPRALPARQEVHLHFHGLGAEAVAEILRRAQDGLPPAS
jgi:hypothetical protein